MTTATTCKNCGKSPSEGSAYCNHCGEKIEPVELVHPAIEPKSQAPLIDGKKSFMTQEIKAPALVLGLLFGGFLMWLVATHLSDALGVVVILGFIGMFVGLIGWILGFRRPAVSRNFKMMAVGSLVMTIGAAILLGMTSSPSTPSQAQASSDPQQSTTDTQAAAPADNSQTQDNIPSVPDANESKDQLEKDIATAKLTGIRMREITKDPENHVGNFVAWKGQIIDINESDGKTIVQVEYYDPHMTGDTFFATINDTTKLYKDDFVVVYGTYDHMQEYKSTAGYDLSAPVLNAFAMKKIRPIDE